MRLSFDDGKTWPVSRLLVPGVFRYNCLAQLPDGTLLCLFERGASKSPSVTLARFTLDWLALEFVADGWSLKKLVQIGRAHV